MIRRSSSNWQLGLIYDYIPAWELGGRDIRTLLTAYNKQGNRSAKYTGKGTRRQKGEEYSEVEKAKAKEVVQVIQKEIQKALTRGKKVKVSELHEAIELAIVYENEPEDPRDRLPVPSVPAIHNFIKGLNKYDRERLLKGKQYADRNNKSNGQGAEYTRPLQRVEYDDTVTDLFVVDTTTRLPLGRATETFGIDCYTGMPHGTHTGFDGTGYLAISRALLHGIQPKSYLKELFPMVEGDWPVFGVPQEIGVDNGPGYVSDDLTDACNQLGSVVDYSPRGDPDSKPYVESFFNVQNNRLLHKVDGTTFSNFLAKGDYDPAKNAVISFDAYMEMKHLFFVDQLAREPNRSRHNTPINLWRLGTKNYPPVLPRRVKDLRILLGKIEVRVIRNSGIEFECLFYNSEELQFLRQVLDGEPVKLKYDPVDISVIYVYDPRKDIYITVPALDQEYAKGLSLWQHQVIKRYTREELNKNVEAETILSAKKKIQDIVEMEWIRTGRSDTRRRLARYMGVRQPDYNSVLEIQGRQQSQPQSHLTVVPEAQSEPPPIPVMMESGSPAFEGGSDFDESLAAQGQSENSPAGPIAQPVSGTLEMGPPTAGHNNKKKEASKKDPSPSKQPGTVITQASDSQDDDDVDTAGFEADFDLPQERRNEPGDEQYSNV